MTIPSIDSFSNYNRYKSEAGYTKQSDMMRYLANQNDCLTALTQALLWQPETAYEVGKVIQSPTMPTGVRARVTQAGTSGQAEPAWTDAGTTVTDGTITYTMESLDYAALIAAATSSLQATMTEAIATAKIATQAEMDAKYLISETEPSNPNDGSLWFDTGNMLIKARINGAWVSFGAVYSG